MDHIYTHAHTEVSTVTTVSVRNEGQEILMVKTVITEMRNSTSGPNSALTLQPYLGQVSSLPLKFCKWGRNSTSGLLYRIVIYKAYEAISVILICNSKFSQIML